MTRPVLDAGQLNRATLARQGLLEPIRDCRAAGVVGRLGSPQVRSWAFSRYPGTD